MILLCGGTRSEKTLDALLLFGLQLRNLGYDVGIDSSFLPDDAPKHQKYEASHFLIESKNYQAEQIMLIGADSVDTETQLLLRMIAAAQDCPVKAVGYFGSYQEQINAANRIAYSMGRDPLMLNMSELQQVSLMSDPITPLLINTANASKPDDVSRTPNVLVYLPEALLEEQPDLTMLQVLKYQQGMKLHILTTGKGKDLVRKSGQANLSVFTYGELPPTSLAQLADVYVLFGNKLHGERLAILFLEMINAGKVVVDCTSSEVLFGTAAPVLRGSEELAVLPSYLGGTVLPNLSEIRARLSQNDWIDGFDIDQLGAFIGGKPQTKEAPTGDTRTVFFPTNGVGLGHAQRCALIAEELATGGNSVFAAFPSCIGMLNNRGLPAIPMVPKSESHVEPYANDLMNYQRLTGLVQDGDKFVFDGGYVFDSVYRLISERKVSSTWVRRGLWQTSHVNATALERERAFDQVIVPQEAFLELNEVYSSGANVHSVGPIVRDAPKEDRDAIRKGLAKKFERPFETLVVTMLGGGIASDRMAQSSFIAGLLDGRENCLNLVVTWPNAAVHSGLYGWNNTKVVYTSSPMEFASAADLTISAVGYNSFHELLYAQIPSIMIPQMAPYMDDQEKRAQAAADRNLTSLIYENELFKLEKEIAEMLDGDQAKKQQKALSEIILPERGNAQAARLIAERPADV